MRSLNIKACFQRNVAEGSVAEIAKQAVGLFVAGGLKLINQIVDVGIGGKQILPADRC